MMPLKLVSCYIAQKPSSLANRLGNLSRIATFLVIDQPFPLKARDGLNVYKCLYDQSEMNSG